MFTTIGTHRAVSPGRTYNIIFVTQPPTTGIYYYIIIVAINNTANDAYPTGDIKKKKIVEKKHPTWWRYQPRILLLYTSTRCTQTSCPHSDIYLSKTSRLQKYRGQSRWERCRYFTLDMDPGPFLVSAALDNIFS